MTSIHPSLRADGVAGRVAAFFAANPDEILGVGDIAEKFDAVRGNVHTLLAKTIELRLLVRDRDSEGDYVYKAGPSLPRPKPGSTPPPVTLKSVRRQAARAPLLDPSTIQLDTDVPIPPLRTKGMNYATLLARMEPGHSAELPLNCAGTLAKAVGEIHKAEERRFVIRRNKATDTMRVWRTA